MYYDELAVIFVYVYICLVHSYILEDGAGQEPVDGEDSVIVIIYIYRKGSRGSR